MTLRAAACALAAAMAWPGPAAAADLGAAGTLSGTYSIIGWRSSDAANGILNTALARLRLRLDGVRAAGSGDLSWLLVYDHEVLAGGLVKTSGFAALAAIPKPTYLDLHREVFAGGAYRWTHRMSRASVGWDAGDWRTIFGRQRVAWGSGRVWNPTDRFNPVAVTSLDAGEKTGSDAVSIERYVGSFGVLQAVAAPGNAARGASRKVALRWRDTVGETDYALLAGRIGDEPVVGLDLATNLFDGGLYFEAAAGWPRGDARYVQFTLGYENLWVPPFLDNPLRLSAEAFRNTAATGAAVTVASADRLQTRRRDHLALTVAYDIGFLWGVQAVTLVDFDSGSTAFLPSLSYSLSQNMDAQVVGQFFHGGPESEYGAAADVFLVRLNAYF